MEAGAAGPGIGGLELRRRMAAQREASEWQIAAGRERAASASAAYRAALLSARSHSHQEELAGLKGRFRELEAHLAQALSIKVRKDSRCELTKESISTTAAINEQLRDLVTDQRKKRDQYSAVISNQLEAVEALEAKSNEDETRKKNMEEAVIWYDRFLGFQVVAGEGVKFFFNKVDLKSPEKDYSFSIKLNKDRYTCELKFQVKFCSVLNVYIILHFTCLVVKSFFKSITVLRCDPHMKDSEELMKDLNLSNNLFKFVRIIRQRFQAATVNGILPVSSVVCPDASSVAVSSPVVMSVDTRSENVANQSHSRSKNKKQALPTKRRAAALSAASPGAVVSSVRRSPRFVGIR